MESKNIKRVLNEALTVPDCWVKDANKLGTAHGEKKLYIGSKSIVNNWFESGTMRCYLLKKDLVEYLSIVESEYKAPKLHYKGSRNFKELYEKRLDKINGLEEKIYFDVDFQKQIQGRRGYVKSNDKAFDLLREISLPLCSYISIMELEDEDHKTSYYWKLFVDYIQLVNPKAKNHHVFQYGKKNSGSRSGQTEFRKNVMQEFNGKCLVSGVDESNLLVASHIKPWAACDKKKEKEHVNPQNGLLLSTLYDRLFDQGYLTFDENCNIIYSTWLSEENRARLALRLAPEYVFNLTEERKKFLIFHQKFIFKG